MAKWMGSGSPRSTLSRSTSLVNVDSSIYTSLRAIGSSTFASQRPQARVPTFSLWKASPRSSSRANPLKQGLLLSRRLVASNTPTKGSYSSPRTLAEAFKRSVYINRSFTSLPSMSDPTVESPNVEENNTPATAMEIGAGAVIEEARVAPVGLSLTIFNLPKTMNDVKFARKLKQLNIKYAKSDKPFNKTAAKIRFENQEDRQAALKALDGLNVDDAVWSVKVPADMGGEVGTSSLRKALAKMTGGDKPTSSRGKDGEEGEGDEEGGSEGEGADGDDDGRSPGTLKTSVKDAVAPWHTFNYDHQLVKKHRSMREILEKIAKRVKKDSVAGSPDWLAPILKQKTKWLACPLLPILPSPITEGYRNKTELTIGLDVNGKVAAGFLLGALKDGVLAVADPREAPNVPPIHAQIHQLIEPFIVVSGLPVWNRGTHTGFWRMFLIRSTINQDSLVMLQVNPRAITPEQFDKLKEDLVKYITESENPVKEQIKSIWIQEHDGVSNAAALDAPKSLLWGREFLEEEMLGAKFRISPTSFFQVNTPAASVLYDLVRQWCGDLDENTTLFDVCCGTGTIGLCISKNSAALKEIVGLEIVEDAVLDAKANAELNSIGNARFIVGKAEETMPKVISEYPSLKKRKGATPTTSEEGAPEHKFVAILDPPRGGVHPVALRAIRECEAISRVVYVSCNPNSLIADASVLTRLQSKSTPGTPFVPIQAQPVDLFPHTPHTELVMMFQRGTPDVERTIAASQHLADNPPPRIEHKKRGHEEVTPAIDDTEAPTRVVEQPALEQANASSSTAMDVTAETSSAPSN